MQLTFCAHSYGVAVRERVVAFSEALVELISCLRVKGLVVTCDRIAVGSVGYSFARQLKLVFDLVLDGYARGPLCVDVHVILYRNSREDECFFNTVSVLVEPSEEYVCSIGYVVTRSNSK